MNVWRQVDPLMLRQGEMVLETLVGSGYDAYWVGGCVRDELMGRPVNDMDIATSAMPEQVLALFERTVPTGLQHGTVTVLMATYSYEVTTFRKESEYEGHRRPTSVEFVSGIEEDLQRRDFTMNAIARNLEGDLLDPFFGAADIDAGIIRCVGNAGERFDEDALRMVRAIRFASVFGFRPIKSVWRSLLLSKDKIYYIATERIRAELERIILGPHPLRGLELLRRSKLLDQAKVAWISGTNAQPKMLAAIEAIPSEHESLRWSVLVQSLDIPVHEIEGLMKRWTFPNSMAHTVASIQKFDEEVRYLAHSGLEEEKLRLRWIHAQIRYGKKITALWLEREGMLQSLLDRDPELSSLFSLSSAWFLEVNVHEVKELAVTGHDVLRVMAKRAGPWLGELMNQLLLEVAYGHMANDTSLLLEKAKEVGLNNGQ